MRPWPSLKHWEKRGGLTVVSFDRSRYKLCSMKFSNKLVQAPSCERPKTAPRTLFLSFANSIFFQYRHSDGLRRPFHIIHLFEITVLYILPYIWKTVRIGSRYKVTIRCDIWGVGKEPIAMFNSARGMHVSRIFSYSSDVIPLFANNSWFQMIETVFAEWF